MESNSVERVLLLLTPAERYAVEVALLPRAARAAMDRINGSTPASRSNALKRARKRLDRAQGLRLLGLE